MEDRYRRKTEEPRKVRVGPSYASEEDAELHHKYGLVRLNHRQFVACQRRCCKPGTER